MVNEEFREILGLSADQRAAIEIFENSGKTEPRINYWPGPDAREWTFQIGDQIMRTSDPDVAAAALGAASSREEV